MKRVAIIGGGPAGMSCALWLKLYGLEPVIIEQASSLGGLQNLNQKTNAWVLGLINQSGPEIAQLYCKHIESEEIPVIYNAELETIEPQGRNFKLKLTGQAAEIYNAIVWATGTRIRGQESLCSIPGFEKISELISFAPLDGVNPKLYAGKTITVLGGGDNAYQAACLIAQEAKQVFLIHRSQAKAQKQLIDRAHSKDNIVIFENNKIEIFDLSQKLAHIILDNCQKIEADYIFARLGYLPNSEIITQFFPDLKLDQANYVKVNPYTMQSSIAGVYAIGDLSDPINPCVPTAVASGTVAARHIEKPTSDPV